MSWTLLVLLALITYGSRALALAVVPTLPERFRIVLDRVPAALFAGLAMHSLVVPGEGLGDGSLLAAAAGALIVAPLRSLPICLVAGIAAFGLWQLLA